MSSSIESLLAEVGRVRISAHRLPLKAAEDIYFGGKQLYTPIAPSSSTGGGGGQHHGGGHHHRGHGHGSGHAPHADSPDKEVAKTAGGEHHGGGGKHHHKGGHHHRGGGGGASPPDATHSHSPKTKGDGEKTSPVVQAIAETRDKVDKALKNGHGKHGNRNRRNSRRSESGETSELRAELTALKEENAAIRAEMTELRAVIERLSKMSLSSSGGGAVAAGGTPPAAAKPAVTPKKEEAEDDDFELFGSDDEEESEEKKKITEQRLADYAAKKAKKPGPIAKSSVILDVKPWDDETDMEDMERMVRAIERDGLVWGGSKFIPLAYGIRKLQIICVIEDDKVSVDDLIEKITEDIADHVQSVDIHAFNKI